MTSFRDEVTPREHVHDRATTAGRRRALLTAFLVATVACAWAAEARSPSPRPNILVIQTESWSWPQTAEACDGGRRPVFARVAREGVFFENAFACSPSETVNRWAVVTGRWPWQVSQPRGAGESSERRPGLVRLLQQAGYEVGFCQTGDGQARGQVGGARRAGRVLFDPQFDSPEEFFRRRRAGRPFCFFWFASTGTQPSGREGQTRTLGRNADRAASVARRPDTSAALAAESDEAGRAGDTDRRASRLLDWLQKTGQLHNTLVVLTGGTGRGRSRGRPVGFNSAPRVALAIRWEGKVKAGRVVTDFVSLCDLAPTFLQAAGLRPPAEMTGRSLLPVLLSDRSGQVDPTRRFVLAGAEGTSDTQAVRAFRTADFLYLVRFEQWQASPTAEELYDLRKGATQVRNVADQSAYRAAKTRLRTLLESKMRAWRDPRFPTPGYEPRSVEGWTVLVSKKLLRDKPDATQKALRLLCDQLRRTVEAVPAPAVAFLRSVPIWVSPVYPKTRPRAEYHPDVGWLKRNGRSPALAKCVELTNVDIFEKEVRRMPVFVLHELAHAYHDQVLGFDNPQVLAAFEEARASGKYERVQRWVGTGPLRVERHYGMNNAREYFAESTEAFFGRNDFFPFTRDQLKQHDPRMFDLVKKLWLCDLDPHCCDGGK